MHNTHNRIARLLIPLFLLSSTGCATLVKWSRLTREVYKDRARGFEAEVPAGWMRFNRSREFVLTKDGIVLDLVMVGNSKFNKALEHTKKIYTPDMSIQELAEVETGDLTANRNIKNFDLISSRPAVIGARDAFRIEYAYETLSGLRMKGIRCGLMTEEGVLRIRFEAAAIHYFQETKGAFERFIKTFRLLE